MAVRELLKEQELATAPAYPLVVTDAERRRCQVAVDDYLAQLIAEVGEPTAQERRLAREWVSGLHDGIPLVS